MTYIAHEVYPIVNIRLSKNLSILSSLEHSKHFFKRQSGINTLIYILKRITSSMINMEQSFKTHTPFFARSRILPGVPTSKWTGWYSLIMSSFKLVPPVVTMTWIFRCFPSSLQTWDVWRANSRVGTRIIAAYGSTEQQSETN